jgi:hypothetical protein
MRLGISFDSGIQGESVSLFQLDGCFELLSQPEKVLYSNLHGFRIGAVLDGNSGLQNIASIVI